jgi:hypothetical protein
MAVVFGEKCRNCRLPESTCLAPSSRRLLRTTCVRSKGFEILQELLAFFVAEIAPKLMASVRISRDRLAVSVVDGEPRESGNIRQVPDAIGVKRLDSDTERG